MPIPISRTHIVSTADVDCRAGLVRSLQGYVLCRLALMYRNSVRNWFIFNRVTTDVRTSANIFTRRNFHTTSTITPHRFDRPTRVRTFSVINFINYKSFCFVEHELRSTCAYYSESLKCFFEQLNFLCMYLLATNTWHLTAVHSIFLRPSPAETTL